MSRIAERARQAVRHPLRAVRLPFVVAERAAIARGLRLPERGIEVWQWTHPKYRIRAIALLLIDIGLFAGLGCFTFWLRTGDYLPFAAEGYWQRWKDAFSLTHWPPVTLVDFLTFPIRVDEAPFMLVILGLVLASMTAIPILVSMLYRFGYALPFTLIICFVAVVPWLAITVTLCCFLARWRPLRFSFHYATGLIALLPLVAYYALATRGPVSASAAGPLEMAKLYLPWVLALIGACVIMAVVLITARLVNYRPGAIAPLLAILFGVPVVLFETQVGRDELYYRLLEIRYGPKSTAHFVDYADATPTIERIAHKRFKAVRDSDPNADEATIREQVRLILEMQWSRIESEIEVQEDQAEESFTEAQTEATSECDEFLTRYPRSRYVPNVLYLKARAMDMRVDRAYFRRTGVLRHYVDFPTAASLPVWQQLMGRQDSLLWTVAVPRVGLLLAREGQVDQAVAALDAFIGSQARAQTQPQRATSGGAGVEALFAKRPASRALDIEPTEVLLAARKLHSLIVKNRDPEQNDRPLVMLLRLDPRHPMYAANLARMLADVPTKYPLTPLRDNLEVMLAADRNSPAPRRIERLSACIQKCAEMKDSDALTQARFELGVAYKDAGRLEDARATFEELSKNNSESPWAADARQRLAAMGVGRTAS